MRYFVHLFSPETYTGFSSSDRTVSGFRRRQAKSAERVRQGDVFVCYMTGLSRWVGLLKVKSQAFDGETPIFVPENDPFVVRFRVDPLVWLPPEKGLPIHEESVWKTLSFTKDHDRRTSTWTGMLRGSLKKLADSDGSFLHEQISKQAETGRVFELTSAERRKLVTYRVRRPEGIVAVSVPDDDSEADAAPDSRAPRESTRIQATVARIGATMGHRIWLPLADRQAVLREWDDTSGALIETLPLNYDETTLSTIERIDVLWLRGRSIVRAFEVEHTTAIYSGILRMADLLALQPNMEIKLHIVAPESRKEKTFEEIRRPVFSLLDRGPLSGSCTFLSYDSIGVVAKLRHLAHLSDSVLEEYVEEA